jgi:hypothetical protein
MQYVILLVIILGVLLIIDHLITVEKKQRKIFDKLCEIEKNVIRQIKENK